MGHALVSHRSSAFKKKLFLQSRPTSSRGLRTSKVWFHGFLQNRTFHDRPYVDTLVDIELELGILTAFLQDTNVAGASWEVEKVQRFLSQPVPIIESRIWLHCRVEGPNLMGKTTEHESRWLTARDLPGIVPPPRNQASSHTIIRRSLTFVPNLTPHIITALVEGASWSQAQSLRAAVKGHMTGKTSIRVTSPVHLGFPIFLLELHLPYAVLKSSASPTTQHLGQNKVLWSNLDFLLSDTRNGVRPGKFSIIAAHTTVVIAGAHNFDWHGYAFGNTGPGDPVAEEYEEEEDAYHCDSAEATADDLYHSNSEDFFISGGCPSIATAGQAIMDPRVYFLRAVHYRLEVVLQSHEYLVRTLDEALDAWLKTYDHRSGNQLQWSLDCIGEMTQLFNQLRQRFNGIIKAWNRFNSTTGDVLYFEDLQDNHARDALYKIEESFERMTDLVATLDDMLETCEKSTKGCKIQLQLGKHGMRRIMTDAASKAAESAESSQRSAEEMTRSTRINIQLLMVTTAVVIALQYFCSERALFAFERSPRMFWASICVLVPSLLLLTHILHALDQIQKPLMDRLFGRLKKTVVSEKELSLDA